jgi:hypothetical protein
VCKKDSNLLSEQKEIPNCRIRKKSALNGSMRKEAICSKLLNDKKTAVNFSGAIVLHVQFPTPKDWLAFSQAVPPGSCLDSAI